MLRRTVLPALASALASACVQVPKPDPNAPPLDIPADAPPPSRIRRLLVWLPPPGAMAMDTGSGSAKTMFSNAVFVEALKQDLQPYGVEIGVGLSSGFELERQDEQRALMLRLKPTHRLEVDLARMSTTRISSPKTGTSLHQAAFMKWQLFDAKDTRPVRFKTFTATGDNEKLRQDVDFVQHLAAQGFL